LLTPQPSIEDLSVLVEQMEAAGLQVRMSVEGEPRTVPVAVGLSTYRIVQEALTNTLKHAGAVRADVVVRYGVGAIEIECADGGGPIKPADAANGGHGLAGMRERATLLGGEVTARPGPDGGFRVRAKLPL
jgi:signal transduction histidine kinase